MRAIAVDEFGTTPSLHDLPIPSPRPGEVLVSVASSSVNNIDLITVAGWLASVMPYEFPVVIGKDLAGRVEALGEGVDGFAVGDPVFGVVMVMALGAQGAFAEQVAVPAEMLARRPEGLSVAAAGVLGLAGCTATAAVDAVSPVPGETVVVAGAAGGVGSIAVQLAKARGARVIGTARPEAADFVRELGADEVVDHTADLAVAVKAVAPDGVHAVVQAGGDPVLLADLLVPGGRLASAPASGLEPLEGRDLQVSPVSGRPSAATLSSLAAAVVDGTLRVPIAATYPLEDVPRALGEFSQPKQGKIAIAVAG